MPILPSTKVRDLGVGAQMVEIARALSQGSFRHSDDQRTIDRKRIDQLMLRVNELRQRGVTFLFISHHLVRYRRCRHGHGAS